MASTFISLPLETGSGPAPGVDSFNGRTGVVVSQAGDYAAGIVANTPAGNISATNVQAAINELDSEKQATITGAATTIVSSNLTASRALESNGSGKVSASSVTSTELGHLSGVTSAVQTQLDAKQPLDSDLTAIAALASNGLVAKTGSGTAAARTITGTSGRISATNGDGVSGNPTLDLVTTGVSAASYVNPNITVDAYGRITAATNGVPGSFDIDTDYEILEDFDGPTAAISNSPLQLASTGTGAAVSMGNSFGVNSTQNAIGVVQFQSGTANNSRSSYTSAANAFTLDSNWEYYFKGRVTIDSYGTVTDPYAVRFGYGDSTAGLAPVDGIFFRFVANGSNLNWECVTSAASVQTAVDSGVVVTLNNFQVFEITMNSTQAQFAINGVTVATITTNLPSTGNLFGAEGIIIKTAAGTAVETNMYIDYLYYSGTIAGGR